MWLFAKKNVLESDHQVIKTQPPFYRADTFIKNQTKAAALIKEREQEREGESRREECSHNSHMGVRTQMSLSSSLPSHLVKSK